MDFVGKLDRAFSSEPALKLAPPHMCLCKPTHPSELQQDASRCLGVWVRTLEERGAWILARCSKSIGKGEKGVQRVEINHITSLREGRLTK
jgi:hypothetical protein